MGTRRLTLLTVLAIVAVACSGESGDDEAARDGGAAFDSGEARDAGAAPDGGSVRDGGTRDGGVETGFGVITGACGEIDDELTSASPAKFDNAIDFMADGYDDGDFDRLTEGGREIIRDGNAGGSSLYSEVFAYEVLARCEGAELEWTETEVEYLDMMGKITDLVVTIDNERIGVSVTRAVKFPFDDPYPVADALDLLEGKLSDVLLSSANVKPEFAWTKQILHVIAYGPQHATALETAYGMIDAATKSDTILVVTVSNGDDDFLY